MRETKDEKVKGKKTSLHDLNPFKLANKRVFYVLNAFSLKSRIINDLFSLTKKTFFLHTIHINTQQRHRSSWIPEGQWFVWRKQNLKVHINQLTRIKIVQQEFNFRSTGGYRTSSVSNGVPAIDLFRFQGVPLILMLRKRRLEEDFITGWVQNKMT